MKKTKLNSSKNVVLAISLGIIATIVSCKFSNNDKKTSEANFTKEIKSNRSDAKLLVKVSEQNLDILELCKVAKKYEEEDKLYIIANKIEEQHVELSKQLNDIAEEKLISIPQKTYKNGPTEGVFIPSENEFKETYLLEVKRLLSKQLNTLNNLAENSSDKDLQLLALEAKSKLKTNLNLADKVFNKP